MVIALFKFGYCYISEKPRNTKDAWRMRGIGEAPQGDTSNRKFKAKPTKRQIQLKRYKIRNPCLIIESKGFITH